MELHLTHRKHHDHSTNNMKIENQFFCFEIVHETQQLGSNIRIISFIYRLMSYCTLLFRLLYYLQSFVCLFLFTFFSPVILFFSCLCQHISFVFIFPFLQLLFFIRFASAAHNWFNFRDSFSIVSVNINWVDIRYYSIQKVFDF